MMDRVNVGGNQSGQQSGFVSKGSSRSDATFNVDGINITDMIATGVLDYSLAPHRENRRKTDVDNDDDDDDDDDSEESDRSTAAT